MLPTIWWVAEHLLPLGLLGQRHGSNSAGTTVLLSQCWVGGLSAGSAGLCWATPVWKGLLPVAFLLLCPDICYYGRKEMSVLVCPLLLPCRQCPLFQTETNLFLAACPSAGSGPPEQCSPQRSDGVPLGAPSWRSRCQPSQSPGLAGMGSGELSRVCSLQVVKMSSSDSERPQLLFVQVLANRGRLEAVTQQMGYHPQYLDSFLKTQHYLMHMDGPLPFDCRHYIAIMVSC